MQSLRGISSPRVLIGLILVLAVCLVAVLSMRPKPATSAPGEGRKGTSATRPATDASETPPQPVAAPSPTPCPTVEPVLAPDDNATSEPLWVADIEPPSPGRHYYWFQINGEMKADPKGQACLLPTGISGAASFRYPPVGDDKAPQVLPDGKIRFTWRGRLQIPASIAGSFRNGTWPMAVLEPANDAARENLREIRENPEGNDVSGVVLNQKQEPVSNATVALTSALGCLLPPMRTDRAGRFAFSGVFHGGILSIHARAPGLAETGEGPMLVFPGVDKANIHLVLPEAAVVRGKVVDDANMPIAGVWVSGLGFIRGTSLAVSDASGHFSCDYLTPGRQLCLCAYAPGFATTEVDVGPVGAGVHPESVTIRMGKGGTIIGRVLPHTGKWDTPPDGVKVIAFGGLGRGVGMKTILFADLRPDGTFALKHVPMDISLTCAATQGHMRSETISDFVLSDSRPTTDVALFLPPPGLVAGIVCDPEGKPVAGAPIKVVPRSDSRKRLVRWDAIESKSDSDGSFAVRDFPAGIGCVVGVEMDGFAAYVSPEVETGTPEAESIRVLLQRGGTVCGRLVRADTGEALAGVDVSLAVGDTTCDAKTEEDGTFALAHVPAGTYREWECSGEGLDLTVEDTPVEVKEAASVDIGDLSAVVLYTVSGTVTDAATGEPAVGVKVEYVTENGEEQSPGMWSVFEENQRTNAEGHFEIDEMKPGRYIIRIERGAYALTDLSAAPLEIADRDVEGIELTIRSGTGILEGRVLNHDGTPVSKARVVPETVRRHSHYTVSDSMDMQVHDMNVRTDARGEYTIRGLQLDRTYRIEVQSAGCGTARSDGTAHLTKGHPRGQIDLRFKAMASISGRVTDAQGKPVSAVDVFEAPDPDSSHNQRGVRTQTDKQGRYRLAGVEPGRRYVGIDSSEHKDVEPRMVEAVALEEVKEVDFVVTEKKDFRGKLVDTEGRPLKGWYASEKEEGDSDDPFSDGNVRADGAFELKSVSDPVTLAFRDPDKKMRFRTGPIPLTGEEVVFRIALGKSLAGRVVVKGTGEPIVGAQVGVVVTEEFLEGLPVPEGREPQLYEYQMAPEKEIQKTGADGRFRIPNLPAGTYVLGVQGGGAQPVMRPGVVVDADPSDAGDIEIDRGAAIRGRLVVAESGLAWQPRKTSEHEAVWAWAGVRTGDDGEKVNRSANITLGEDGEFHVSSLPLDTVEVQLHFARAQQVSLPVNGLKAGEELDVGDVSVVPGLELCGMLKLEGTGRPATPKDLPDAPDVWFVREDEKRERCNFLLGMTAAERVSDAANYYHRQVPADLEPGRFLIRNAPPDAHTMELWSGGVRYLCVNPLPLDGPSPVDIGEYELRNCGSYTWRLVGRDGEPIKNVMANALGLSRSGEIVIRYYVFPNSEEQVYSIKAPPAGLESLRLFPRCGLPVNVTPPAFRDGVANFGDIRIERGETLIVRLRKPNGKPPNRCEVKVFCMDTDQTGYPDPYGFTIPHPRLPDHVAYWQEGDYWGEQTEIRITGLYPGTAIVRILLHDPPTAPDTTQQTSSRLYRREIVIERGKDNLLETVLKD